MLMSVEHEIPAVPVNGTAGVLPEVFESVWDSLEGDGWKRKGRFGVSRIPSVFNANAKKAEQAFSTDTGPTLEMASTPAESVNAIETQLRELRNVIMPRFSTRGIALLGSGVHPFIGISEEEYLRFRTPRSAYEYAVNKTYGRAWDHRTLLNIAAIQEVVDVPISRAPTILSVMHRLAGIFFFLLRNDPDYRGDMGGRLSVRPFLWREQVAHSRFPEDRHKVCLPESEVSTWSSYLRLLWGMNPMFILGTKNSGLVYIPEHPTFAKFMVDAPAGGWIARRLDTGEEVRIIPQMDHVRNTDWSYMGFARLRLFWKENTKLSDVIAAYLAQDEKATAMFMEENLEKVLIENRSSATPPPGSEMCSLALIVGLLENIGAVERFVEEYPYDFWLSLAAAAEQSPFDTSVRTVDVPRLAQQILVLARNGLIRRDVGEEMYLENLQRRITDKQSHSELMLELANRKGIDAVVESLRYKQ
jgi:gamma-glutamylcysteine synthetase